MQYSILMQRNAIAIVSTLAQITWKTRREYICFASIVLIFELIFSTSQNRKID